MTCTLVRHLSVMQFEANQLLSQYLNGGLGAAVIAFPLYQGCSKNLVMQQLKLQKDWELLAAEFNIANPFEDYTLGRPSIEIFFKLHYEHFPYDQLRNVSCGSIFVATDDSEKLSGPLDGLRIFKSLEPYLHSYWFHGSVGDGTFKNGWSDVDGLAIVSTDTIVCSSKLKALRRRMIRCRAPMSDIQPYQLHGHFVVAESDLKAHLREIFPLELLSFAHPIFGHQSSLSYGQYSSVSIAHRMLVQHGLKDLMRIAPDLLTNTKEKVKLLHRIYLLPCLIAQMNGAPVFKRDAFRHLPEIVPDSCVESFVEANVIWERWIDNSNTKKIWFNSLRPLKFNPILYQKAMLYIGKYISWLDCYDDLDWLELSRVFKRHAIDLYGRLVDE